MTNFSCAVKVEFDAAHRLIGHKGKCSKLHGHRYFLEVTITADKLNELGMVVDFAELKGPIKSWIDENFDHNVILWSQDKELGESISAITKQKIYYMPCNPTAENMAFYLKNNIFSKIFAQQKFIILSVSLQETSSCSVVV
jgi:6-pyruvoyltetrahydropterin/6-carboxytetrahydropterin synthase